MSAYLSAAVPHSLVKVVVEEHDDKAQYEKMILTNRLIHCFHTKRLAVILRHRRNINIPLKQIELGYWIENTRAYMCVCIVVVEHHRSTAYPLADSSMANSCWRTAAVEVR